MKIFEKNDIASTLLPTGGGRCNIANAIYDFKELAKNYPRGEKFLYSIFSRFSTEDTVNFFEEHNLQYPSDWNDLFTVAKSIKDEDVYVLGMAKKHIILIFE